MTAPQLKVLVSGAGVAGPCFAYWLARTRLNASITVIERSHTPRATGQAIDIHGAAIEVMQRMKMLDTVRSFSTTEEGTQFLNSSGKPFAQFKAGETFTAEYEILRADLVQVFLDATKRFKNVRYMYGDYITALEQTEKTVHVNFANGSEDNFDLVVGADGASSKIRSMILDEQALKDCYHFWGQYNAFFSIPRRLTDTKMWKIYNRQKGLCIMIRPHRNPSTMGAYLSITTSAHGVQDEVVEEAMRKGTENVKKVLHSYFEDAGWEAKRVLEGMDCADDFYMSRTAQVKLLKWTNGRAAVLGDAAWATFGVGTTLAIEGAYMLAGELSKLESSNGIPQALERYEKVFRQRYAKVEDVMPGFPQMLFPQTALGLGIRDTALWFLSKTKAYKILGNDPRTDWELPDYDWMDI